MARMRVIKPTFFTDDELAELPLAARFLFIGLWTIADREGRFEDRPKRIKVQVLPFDDVDVDELLTNLSNAGFVTRYEVGGKRYAQVNNFLRHQRPHHKEEASMIQPCPNVESSMAQASTDIEVIIPIRPAFNYNGDNGDNRNGDNREVRASRKIPERIPQEFLDELMNRYYVQDFAFELQKWRDHVAVKPPKGNWKNSLRNWMERCVVPFEEPHWQASAAAEAELEEIWKEVDANG